MSHAAQGRPITPSRFFLDESGTSGDLSKTGPGLDFKRQPIFVLAAIGCDDDVALAGVLEAIRRRRFPQAKELKSSSGHATPKVITELLDGIAALGGVVLLEVMDKRFTLAVNLINTLILRPLSPADHAPNVLWFRAQLAEHLHDTAPPEVYDAFVLACREPGEATLKAAFRAVLNWVPPSTTSRETPAGAIRFFALDSLKDFRKAGPSRLSVQRRFLPLPDPGHTGKDVWILPHLSAFTNLYARINRLRSGQLGEVQIVHDEQPYFKDILHAAKDAVERLAGEGEDIPLQRADYRFSEAGSLTFAASAGSPGVQVADLLAGFAMRHVRDTLAGEAPGRDSDAVFLSLADGQHADQGVGMNLMLSNRDVLRCGLLPSRDPSVHALRRGG